MNRIIITFSIFLCIAFTAFAQDDYQVLKDKDGVAILPEAGSFALGMDLSRLIFGNDAFGLYGKYFLDSDKALRVKLNYSSANREGFTPVTNDAEYAKDPALNGNITVLDVENYINYSATLRLGFELRKGAGRLQSFYGAEVGLGFSSTEYEYRYANPITEANPQPSSASGSYGGYGGFSTGYNQNTARTLKREGDLAVTPVLALFLGAEYFVAPKLSIGGEVNLAGSYRLGNQADTTTERWDAAKGAVVEETTRKSGGFYNTFSVNLRPCMFLIYHF